MIPFIYLKYIDIYLYLTIDILICIAERTCCKYGFVDLVSSHSLSFSLSLSHTHTHTHTLRAADVKDSPEPCNLGGPTVVQEVLQPASNANVAEPQEGTSVMQPPKKNKRRMVEQ